MSSPFNEQKYKGLLEGLEVSEHNYNEVVKDIFRLDSEPFQKINQVNFNKFETEKLSNITFTNPVKSEISDLDRNLPVSFVPMTMLGNGIINQQEEGRISDFVKAGYTYFAEDDILVAKITPCMEHGKCAIAKNLKNGIGFGSTEYNVFRIKDDRILKEYLFAFLNRDIIRKQAENNMIGTSGRQRVPIAFYENLLIPIIDTAIQRQVKNKIDSAHSKRDQSQTLYSQAEELLIETIGLKDFTPSQAKTNIKTFKESFLSIGRLDAEYYQPKYEKLINHIETFETERLNKIVCIKKSIEPGSEAYEEEGIPFIRVADLSKFGLTETDIYLDKEKYRSLGLQPKKDTILLSKDGSVGIAYKVEQDLDIITSSALLHLTVTNKDFLPDYVTLVLNSEVIKMQAERDAGGSIIQHWKPSEIAQVIIPKIPIPIQQQISALIQESFVLRKESEKLLVEAKEMVEGEIEK